jgi:hypothetical protein
MRLRRYDEARQELQRAVGNDQAAAEARQTAMETYLAYRQDGGENLFPSRQLFDLVRQALRQGETEAASQALSQLAGQSDAPDYLKPLIPALQAILDGSRDPSLADDPNLDYDDAELRLLLEDLGA